MIPKLHKKGNDFLIFLKVKKQKNINGKELGLRISTILGYLQNRLNLNNYNHLVSFGYIQDDFLKDMFTMQIIFKKK